jgi:methylaspartate mutase epsilon subunit
MTGEIRVLIAGLGDDSHSIGMHLLTGAFREHGIDTHCLGTGNALRAICEASVDFDVVLISCSNQENYIQNIVFVSRPRHVVFFFIEDMVLSRR